MFIWWDAPLDLALHTALRLGPTSRWVRRVVWFTAIGGLTVAGPLVLLVVGWLAWRRRWRTALWLFLTVGGGRLAVELLKLVVRRPRPPAIDRLEFVTSWSFPSAHSAGTMVACFSLAALAGGGWVVMGVALLLAVLIGWTRVALAVHWPSDVLAGWAIGLLWVAAALRWRPQAGIGA